MKNDVLTVLYLIEHEIRNIGKKRPTRHSCRGYTCAGYVRRVTHDEIADAVG
jgi:hypothetical protein